MKLKVVLDPQADRDIEDVFNYLADRNIDAALRFLKAADDTFDALAEMPGMGSLRQFKNPKLVGLRMWAIKGFPNYLAFYLTTEESIRVLRVLCSLAICASVAPSSSGGERLYLGISGGFEGFQ